MRSKFFLFFFKIIFSVSILLSCKSEVKEDGANTNKKKPSVKVDAFIVFAKELSKDIVVPGSLIPFEETEIHPETSGRVTEIFFREGTDISKGTVLVKLFDGDLMAQLNKLNIQLKVAEQTLGRYDALLKINGVSQQEYDQYKLSVSSLQADKQILQTNIEKTRIRAPYHGKVGLRNISLGAYVNPQTILTTIRQVNPLKLDFSVPEKYGSILKIGTKVYFSLENENKNYAATILATENNIAIDSRSLRIKARVDQSNPKLIAGTFVKVNCNLGKNNAALMIPSQAVIPKSRNKQVMLYKNGSAKIQIVKTGVRDSSMVEITSGLNVGDTILTTGLLSVKPGAAVKLNKIKN